MYAKWKMIFPSVKVFSKVFQKRLEIWNWHPSLCREISQNWEAAKLKKPKKTVNFLIPLHRFPFTILLLLEFNLWGIYSRIWLRKFDGTFSCFAFCSSIWNCFEQLFGCGIGKCQLKYVLNKRLSRKFLRNSFQSIANNLNFLD